MKKLLLVLLSASMLTACLDGEVDTSGNDLILPEHYYEVDGWGANPDIYEFTPRSNTAMACIIYKETKTGFQCIPKDPSVTASYKAGSNTDLHQPDFYYEIDGWGSNPDVYEFTPKSNSNYTCIIYIEGGNGFQCFAKNTNSTPTEIGEGT